MTAGSKTFKGLAVPLWGESTITQVVAATDVLTFQMASAATGNAINVLDSTGASVFAVGPAGVTALTPVAAAGSSGVVLGKGAVGQTAFARLRLPILATAPASAGLTKGDIWLASATTDVYRFALCISTATGAARYGHRFTRQTLGTASH